MGESSISTRSFSIAMLVYQRVSHMAQSINYAKKNETWNTHLGISMEKMGGLQGGPHHLTNEKSWVFKGDIATVGLPSGELTFCHGKIHHFLWENPLFLWPFSIAMLVHQRVCNQLTILESHLAAIFGATRWNQSEWGDTHAISWLFSPLK